MKIQIHYCTVWNYEPRAAGLAEAIRKKFAITPEMIPGSNGIYEIVVDGDTIFSKHLGKKFPENDEILEIIKTRL